MSRHIVIVGLGLIGGSMAKALRGFEDFDLIGVDVSEPTLRYALEQDVVDRVEPDPAKAWRRGTWCSCACTPRASWTLWPSTGTTSSPGPWSPTCAV